MSYLFQKLLDMAQHYMTLEIDIVTHIGERDEFCVGQKVGALPRPSVAWISFAGKKQTRPESSRAKHPQDSFATGSLIQTLPVPLCRNNSTSELVWQNFIVHPLFKKLSLSRM
jgi:hypothetical protein